MPLVLKDRVKETTLTTGTGTLTLAGAVLGFQSFSVIGNGNTTYYAIYDKSSQDWEVGVGTYTASGSTLSRDTVLSSSNSNALVNFIAGPKDVWVDYPAGKAVTADTLADSLGTMASQDASNVAITGGTIGGQDVVGFGQTVIFSKLNLMGL